MEPGSRTGHYEILRPLGKGGMGEVYLASDTRLGREVALKVLPDALKEDPERLSRFRREAQAAARLKHPNIATIHALEEFDGELLITMEHIEGRPLKDRIPSGGMALETLLDIFIPLADALAHAHEQGRVHRDLKPDNVMIEADGTPKVLDFGLAHIVSTDGEPVSRDSGGTSSDVPTRMDEREAAPVPVSVAGGVPSLTRGGQLVGTPQYMSPEQAEGEATDARTDIFSFGVVMYEAWTGQRPFGGKSLESIIGRILTSEPTPIPELKPGTPHSLDLLIGRCLRKKRDERIQSARELLADLRDVRRELAAGKVLVERVSESAATARPGKVRAWQLAAGAGVLLGLAGILARFAAPEPEKTVRRFTLQVSRPQTALGAELSEPAISPDGKRVAYVDNDSLWIRALDQVEPRMVEDTVGAYAPFWSPDGESIGYGRNSGGAVTPQGNALWRVATDGGTTVKLCDLPAALMKAVWLDSGEIVVGLFRRTDSVLTISDRGGTPSYLSGELPELYPFPFHAGDARSVLIAFADNDGARLEVLEGSTLRSVDIAPDAIGGFATYASTGHMLHERGLGPGRTASLWATPFSTSTMTTTGPSFLVAQNATHASVSSDGTLVYQIGNAGRLDAQELIWVDRSGAVLGTIGEPQYRLRNPVLSPDERRVAVRTDLREAGTESSDIWLHEVDRPVATRLLSLEGFDEEPSWSADGKRIVWARQEIVWTSVDAPETPTKLVDRGSYPSFSSDGRYLVYHVGTGVASNASRDIWYLPLEKGDDAEPIPYLQTDFEEGVPVVSPDGRYLAYVSDETGSYEVYVQRFPERGNKRQVSIDGGVHPRWSKSGTELFFVSDNTLMAAPVQIGDTLEVGAPTRLFDGAAVGATLNTRVNLRTTYDVSRDGERFVVVRDIRSDDPTPIVVVENWYEAFRDQE